MSRKPTTPRASPLDEFELPPEIMSATLEHAIGDDASSAHERGHAVAAALQKLVKGSTVEYGYPGVVTAHLRSGAVARCGGPTIGWLVDIERTAGAHVATVAVELSAEEIDPERIAAVLASVLKRR